jgi:hypothetical protein
MTVQSDNENVKPTYVKAPLLGEFSDAELKEMDSFDNEPIEDAGTLVSLKAFINSIIDELPDQRITEFNQKLEFIIKQNLSKELNAKIKDAIQQTEEKFRYDHPKAEDLKFINKGRVVSAKYSKLPYGVIYTAILDCILDRRNSLTTQKAILESVKKSTGIKELNANIWKIGLKAYVFSNFNKRINDYGLRIPLTNCKTLSDVRKAIEAHFTKLKAVHKAKLNVSISDEVLTVNGTSYNISIAEAGNSKYKRIRVTVNNKRQWLRVDSLKTLFGM